MIEDYFSHKITVDLNSDSIYGKGMKGFVITNNTGFAKSYSQVLDNNGMKNIDLGSDGHKDIQQSLVNYSSKSLVNYFHNLLIGVTTDNDVNKINDNKSINITVWHNYIAYHSLPISVNLMTNGLLKQLSPDKDYKISVTNKPFIIEKIGIDLHEYRQRERMAGKILIGTDYVIFLCVLSFTSAAYVLQPLTEWRNKFKLIQYIFKK